MRERAGAMRCMKLYYEWGISDLYVPKDIKRYLA
jgi:hypothetical protein